MPQCIASTQLGLPSPGSCYRCAVLMGGMWKREQDLLGRQEQGRQRACLFLEVPRCWWHSGSTSRPPLSTHIWDEGGTCRANTSQALEVFQRNIESDGTYSLNGWSRLSVGGNEITHKSPLPHPSAKGFDWFSVGVGANLGAIKDLRYLMKYKAKL